ncbi:helix-turn-helix domain-containing protein [Lysinibacillus sphaericus]|uniref:HTH cro/C1-type domain-containing protein n=2 Tax=Lysinibacillus sphaericus TaxID=1421 RepID=A0A6H0A061_LYSSH|nr:helix-turn-helix transcriptional regulator [Lysinibacillus sphaericus]MBE5085785.1 helix-turn-helix transcriptional regulator [Bacillus thuringiensis]ACA42368.1 hypothetical protein Bsph_p138 [Lysinibacillus sphaericus C3-41]AMO35350.1 hypothetical protein AR327_22945 [Lysinibacillus sphaericus]AMR93047.1 hypothetical protein A1T07_22840 [Lysinibacillus sphaericus]MDR0161516.1 helix-turn-helix transcriptional regulator [Lysinibacillus sphaericus]
MIVILDCYGSPKYNQNPLKPVGNALKEVIEVTSIEEAIKCAKKYINKHRLRNGNWKGGLVYTNDSETYLGAITFYGGFVSNETDFGRFALSHYHSVIQLNARHQVTLQNKENENPPTLDRNESIRKAVASNLKDLLLIRKVSQNELSNGTKIAKTTIADYVRGTTLIKLENLEKIARFLNIEPAYIDPTLGGAKPITKESLIEKINELFDNNELIHVDDARLKTIWY